MTIGRLQAGRQCAPEEVPLGRRGSTCSGAGKDASFEIHFGRVRQMLCNPSGNDVQEKWRKWPCRGALHQSAFLNRIRLN
jgi:hypothetical protein